MFVHPSYGNQTHPTLKKPYSPLSLAASQDELVHPGGRIGIKVAHAEGPSTLHGVPAHHISEHPIEGWHPVEYSLHPDGRVKSYHLGHPVAPLGKDSYTGVGKAASAWSKKEQRQNNALALTSVGGLGTSMTAPFVSLAGERRKWKAEDRDYFGRSKQTVKVDSSRTIPGRERPAVTAKHPGPYSPSSHEEPHRKVEVIEPNKRGVYNIAGSIKDKEFSAKTTKIARQGKFLTRATPALMIGGAATTIASTAALKHRVKAKKQQVRQQKLSKSLPDKMFHAGRWRRVLGYDSRAKQILLDNHSDPGLPYRVSRGGMKPPKVEQPPKYEQGSLFEKSLLPNGVWKPAAKLTLAERAKVLGTHKRAVGVTAKDRDVAERVTRSTTQARMLAMTNPGETVKLRHGSAKVVTPPKLADVGSFYSATGSAGGQRRATRLAVVKPDKDIPTGDLRAHELTHATRRKPMSAAVRQIKYPEKIWGDEARSDAAMSRQGRMHSGYRATANNNPRNVVRDVDEAKHVGETRYQLPNQGGVMQTSRPELADFNHSRTLTAKKIQGETQAILPPHYQAGLRGRARYKQVSDILEYKGVAKSDSFLATHRDRISPKAEAGYEYLREGRNRFRSDARMQTHQAVGSAAMSGLSGWLTAHEVARGGSKPAIAVAGLSAAASGVNAAHSLNGARQSKRSAKSWDSKMDKIKAKAHERANAGLYGPGRGKTPVDHKSRAKNLAKVTTMDGSE